MSMEALTRFAEIEQPPMRPLQIERWRFGLGLQSRQQRLSSVNIGQVEGARYSSATVVQRKESVRQVNCELAVRPGESGATRIHDGGAEDFHCVLPDASGFRWAMAWLSQEHRDELQETTALPPRTLDERSERLDGWCGREPVQADDRDEERCNRSSTFRDGG